jgi:hypothetical protein
MIMYVLGFSLRVASVPLQRSILGASGKVDSCAAKLCSEVVHVTRQEKGSREEKSGHDSSGSGLSCGRSSDDTILSDDLDSFNVRACRLVGVVDIHLGFTLSRDFVKSVAHFVDFTVSSTAYASKVDNGLLGVREGHTAVDHLEHFGTIIGGHGACIIVEDTKTDLSTLFRAVWSNIVGNVISVVVVVVTVVLVKFTCTLAFVVVHVHLSAGDIVIEVHVVVGKVTTASVVLIVVHVLRLHLGHVRLDVSFHINEVVSVVGVATSGSGARARIGRAPAESNKALSRDLDIIFAISIVVPLLDVGASLELHAVSCDVAVVNVVPVDFTVVTIVLAPLPEVATPTTETTSLIWKLTSSLT